LFKLDRAIERGAEVKVVPKEVNVSQVEELSNQLMAMGIAQQRGMENLVESLNTLMEVVKSKNIKQTDLSEVLSAIRQIKIQAIHEQHDYKVEFERDNKGRIKSGLKFLRIN
jgi:hypothetical protein